ncbi:hypothetical protein [Cupriavidus sp. SZY C1]|uniref:hypothetical protein n=1 Tax=Cupriavidus sp. SZY C1 TaxID=3055037 RepID=UPI0028BF41CA|nr:hypothetical protein [Cupriavidus sp. SZY C1]
MIKAEVFPYYDCDVHGELTKLERCGFVRRYVARGIAAIEILNFKRHQSPHHTEKASDLPAFEERDDVSHCFTKEHEINGDATVSSPNTNGGNPPDSLIPDSLIPDCVKGSAPPATAAPSTQPAAKKPKAPKAAKPAKVSLPDNFAISERVRRWAAEKGHGQLDAHLESFVGKCRANGYQYIDWDDAFMTAIREDWGKIRGRVAPGQTPGGPPPTSGDWAASPAGVAEMAKRHGLEQQEGEHYLWFRLRVIKKHGDDALIERELSAASRRNELEYERVFKLFFGVAPKLLPNGGYEKRPQRASF